MGLSGSFTEYKNLYSSRNNPAYNYRFNFNVLKLIRILINQIYNE